MSINIFNFGSLNMSITKPKIISILAANVNTQNPGSEKVDPGSSGKERWGGPAWGKHFAI